MKMIKGCRILAPDALVFYINRSYFKINCLVNETSVLGSQERKSRIIACVSSKISERDRAV